MNAPHPNPRARTSEAAVAAVASELTRLFGTRAATAAAVREQHGHTLTWIANQPPHVVIADVLVYPLDQAGSGKIARRS